MKDQHGNQRGHRFSLCTLVSLCLCGAQGYGQSSPTWEVAPARGGIQIDGFLDDWNAVPALILRPAGGVLSNGSFGNNVLQVQVRALWDKQSLYLAIEWRDDTWDVQEVARREAVWITPDNQRRDRMYFYDNFKFSIQEADYDYTLWVSPRVGDRGPFLWQRLLQGLKGMEMATASPMVTGRFQNGTATLEVMFFWKELRIKPKGGRQIPLSLMVADSDLPGKMLETKLNQLKSLEWNGKIRLLPDK